MRATPTRVNGHPTTQELFPNRALRVQAESIVCDALITHRPTATVTKHSANVTALFMRLV